MSAEESETIPLLRDDSLQQSEWTWEVEEAMDAVGFGTYQMILWFFLLLVPFSCGFNNMAMVFEGGSSYLCTTPKNITARDNSSVLYYASECSYNQSTVFPNGSRLEDINVQCHSWTFDRSVFNTTIVSEWDLECAESYLVSLTSTVYMLGFFFGCCSLGYLSDRFGRRSMLLLAAMLTLLAGTGAAFSPNYAVFIALRFFIGVGVAGTRNSAYILMTEMARAKDRGTIGLLSDCSYSVSYILTGGIFYLDPNWRKTQLYIGSSAAFYLLYLFFMPESPRWLLSKGSTIKAMKYFRTSANVNRKFLPEGVKVVLQIPPQISHSVLDLVRTPNLRRVSIVSGCIWFIVALVYFGISFNVGNLQGNIYINNLLLGGIEMLANFAGIWIVRIGRRTSLIITFFIGAVSMLAIIFALDNRIAVIVLALIGKFAIAPAFSFICISTAELYPTQVRNLAVGVGSGLARIGGAVAPLIIQLGSSSHKSVPYVVFTVCAFVAMLLSFLLPETANRELPDTIQRAESMNTLSSWKCCGRNEQPLLDNSQVSQHGDD